MHKFYLNSECSPPSSNLQDYTQLFQNTLSAYNRLVTNPSLQIESGVVTEKLPEALKVGSNFSLGDVIKEIQDRVMRSLAYSYFIKYPIEAHIEDWEANYEMVEDNKYQIMINGTSFRILSLAFVALDRGFAFTVPTHQDLKQNLLYFIPKDTEANLNPLELWNLYGYDATNTGDIESRIKDLNTESLGLFEKLMHLLDAPIYDERQFKKAFEALSIPTQTSIVRKFTDAVNQDAIDTPDDNTVKDVTPSKKPQCIVLELRIYSPVAIRVYFNKTEGKVYLASIGLKAKKKAQSTDITHAHSVLVRLMAENTR